MDFQSRLRALTYTLVPGSTGDDVAALHAYLLAIGYFPNAQLAREYPRWRPLVAERPASLSVYDERTAEAVGKLQAVAGLPLTGIVDDETLALLRGPRCAEPDGITPLSADEKYAVYGWRWPGSIVTWYFDMNGLPGEQARTDGWQRVRDAFDTWLAATSMGHYGQSTAGGAMIRLRIATIPAHPAFGGQTTQLNGDPVKNLHWPDQPALVTFNSVYVPTTHFGASFPPPGGLSDFQLLAQHEIGHALGLDHSTMGYAPGSGFSTEIPVMKGSYPARRSLAVDDKIAISMLYDTWTQIDSDTSDIGVGLNGDAWAVAASNHNVWKFNGGWANIGGDAGPIAVGPNGWPYVIAGWGDGTIWFYNSNIPGSGIWQPVPGGGCARDIGVGRSPLGTNDIWVIGCDANPDGSIWKFGGDTGGVWRQLAGNGRAYRITAGSDGRPWMANFMGDVYRYSTNSINGYWELMTSSQLWPPKPGAFDIGVGPGDYPWIIDQQTAWPNALNKQPMFVEGVAPHAQIYPERNEYIALPINGIEGFRIAVGPNGDPWVADNQHRLFKTIK